MISFIENKIWYIHNFIEGSSKLLIAYAFVELVAVPTKTNEFEVKFAEVIPATGATVEE
jgi:hypothetical protein